MRCIGTFRHRLFWLRRNLIAVSLLLTAFAAPAIAGFPATVTVTVNSGYARMMFAANEYIDASTRVSGNVLIISFKEPVDISVDRIAQQAFEYVGAARRDPDGKAIRVALARPVTVNTMSAGEKFFVDLLPDTWKGLPPGLPQDVVDELARRAREADLVLKRERQKQAQKKVAPIRVHVATLPTFTRYVFDVSSQVTVSADRAKDRLVLNFDAALSFDLTDAVSALPITVGEITSELDTDSAIVRFIFADKVDVRTFRDENGYVVDVVNPTGGANQAATPVSTPVTATPQSQASQSAPARPQSDVLASAVAKIEAAKTGAPVAVTPPPATSPPVAPTPASAAPAAQAQPAPQPVPPVTPTPPAAPAATVENKQNPPEVAKASPPVASPLQIEAQPAAVSPIAMPSSPPQAVAPAPAVAPVVASKPQATPAEEQTPPKVTAAKGKIGVELVRDGNMLKLSFPLPAPVGAAVFRRADALWLVFDSKAEFDLAALDGEPSHTIRSFDQAHTYDATVIRLKLSRPQLASVSAKGAVWTVNIGDTVVEPTRGLEMVRNTIGGNRSSVAISVQQAQQLHRILDPDAGDNLTVITAMPPARGFINGQDFVEFRTLASTQGVVIEPLADDLNVELAPDKVVISRPSGLTLSSASQTLLHGGGLRTDMFDSQVWGVDRESSFWERQTSLMAAAAAAPENKRFGPRIDLARFYLARDMYPEAKGVLDIVLTDDRPTVDVVSATVLRSIAEVMMNRPEEALEDLGEPGVGDQHDAALWRSLAYARQGKWAQAREGFKTAEATVAMLPAELQRITLKDEMRSALEVGDFDGASTDLNDFQSIGVPHSMEPTIAVLMGRLAEGLGRNDDALAAYRTAADSWDRPVAAQGLLRETVLRYQVGELKRDAVISQLESLTTIWRGDETEIEALKDLAHLYTEDGRFRDAFYVMRSAMAAHPNSSMTRQIQDEAAATFESLFLTAKGDAMPAIDALAMFYDFRELTPVGSRGDEMIRRLADRLVSVDLLEQASDLLQYQVDQRMQGAARAQIATRLAVIYLMNRKPDRALAALRATRTADLSTDLRNQRLLLEARALSDLGRHDVAVEVIGNIDSREASRLRSDILWAAHRWDEASEQLELMYGDRYRDFTPLTTVEQQDMLRAEIGYALSDDKLGLGRLREKYAAKMAETPEGHDFDVVSQPLGSSGDAFAAIAHAATSVDTLENFLRDMKARYPETGAASPANELQPSAPGAPSVSASPPQTRPAAPPKMKDHTAAL
ncbi:MAG TPA: tetratricopeptide repeat protein [Xanthobacteraceae bacterium]|jgi:tetratricopeptide (TPR) repeat protein|nr:tetratricopeptide repeat protein [Xanthobacteraceae bacterium]